MNKFDPFDENQTAEEQQKEPMNQSREPMNQNNEPTSPQNEMKKKPKETTFLEPKKASSRKPQKKEKREKTYDPTSRLVSFLLVLLVVVASFTGGYLYSEFSLEEDARVSRWLVNVLNENAYFADYGIDSTVLLRYGLKFALREDPYAVLMTPEETDQYLMQSQGRSTSIGMSVAEFADTKGVSVIGVVGGSPAEKQGVKEGYRLLSVDGVNVWESTVAEIGEILNAKADNTDITIVFGLPTTETDGKITYSKDNTETLVVQRTQFTPVIVNYFDSDSPLYSEFLDSDTAYIQIESFVGKTKEQFDEVMKTFKEKGKKNLILDLRDNTGGSDINLMGVGSHLVGGNGEKNPLIITEKFRNKEDREIKAYNNYYSDYNFDQIIVLTNENSASASEALLTSMIDYGTVDLIIGTTTYGKGTGLQTHFMPYLGYGVTFTASYFFSPKGNSHEGVGLSPTKGYEMIDSRSFPYQLDTDAIFMRAINFLK